MNILHILTGALLPATALSADAFIAGFAYGAKNIKIPCRIILAINLISASALGASVFLGTLLRPFLPAGFCRAACFLLLFFVGLSKLLDSAAKELIRRRKNTEKHIKLSVFSFSVVLSVYANPEAADADASKQLSLREACTLAAALSLDGAAAGFGTALGSAGGAAFVLCAFITDTVAVISGRLLGNKLSGSLPAFTPWLSGAVLIILAIAKLM